MKPLTSPQWESVEFPIPAGETTLTEVMVMLPEEGDRVVMHIIAAEEDAERAVALAFREGRKLPGYELTVKQF